MTNVLRFTLALLPWLLLLWLLVSEARGRLAGEPRRQVATTVARSGAVGVLSGAVSLAIAVAAASALPRIPALALSQSGVLDVDLDRMIDVLTLYSWGYYRTTVHPLVCLLFQPPTLLISRVCGVSDLTAAQLCCDLMLAFSSALLGFTVYHVTRRIFLAGLSVVFYSVSFAFLFHACLPESAALASATVVLPYLLFACFRGQPVRGRERLLWILTGVLTLGVTTTNVVPTLMVLGLRLWSQAGGWKRWLRDLTLYGAAIAAIAALFAAVQSALYHGSQLWFLPQALLQEGGYLHASLSLASMGSTILQVLGFSMIGPRFIVTDDLVREWNLLIPYISAEGVWPTTLPVLTNLLLVAVAVVLAWVVWRARGSDLRTAVALGIGFNLGLHLLYGNQYLIYAGNWTVLICLAVGLTLEEVPRTVSAVAGLFIPFVLLNNATAGRQLVDLIREHGTRAALHLPVGIPGSHELRRSFVSWTGSYSPGIGSCGVHFTVLDGTAKKTNWSDMIRGTAVDYDLEDGWKPIPIVRSRAGSIMVTQWVYGTSDGVLTRFRLERDPSSIEGPVRLLAVVSDAGPAGSSRERQYEWFRKTRSVRVHGESVLMADRDPSGASIVPATETGARLSTGGNPPVVAAPWKENLRVFMKQVLGIRDGPNPRAILAWWDDILRPGSAREFWFYSPATAIPAVPSGADLAAARGLGRYAPAVSPTSSLASPAAAESAAAISRYWSDHLGEVSVDVPDVRWANALRGAAAQMALGLQSDGRLPVSPVNYGPFTRDAAYMVYGLVVTGQAAEARTALDYLFRNPWAGRPYPEGDTPGHLLWAAGRYWSFSRDERWLREHLPAIRNLITAVETMRSSGTGPIEVDVLGQARRINPGPAVRVLRDLFARASLPRLNYGTMDGNGLLYVNLVSIAGLKGAEGMLAAAGDSLGAESARRSAQDLAFNVSRLLEQIRYDLAWDERGECVALWPAGFQHFDDKVLDFYLKEREPPTSRRSVWPYLDLDAAHNELMAGSREAASRTVSRYSSEPNFQRWKVLDEGGLSSPGYWWALATNPPWYPKVASPHGWSLASLLLLMRDSLVYEDAGRLVLLAGIPSDWLAPGKKWRMKLPTAYGVLDLSVDARATEARFALADGCRPPGGLLVRLPAGFTPTELRADPGPFALTVARSRH